MKHLEQTNRAILFSKINSDAVSLPKILTKIEDENNYAISEELLKDIEENLVVDSFEKYLEKFRPTIYSRMVNGEVEYSLKKDGAGNWAENPINLSNDFIRLILNIIDGKSGVKNIEFEYQDEFKKLLGVEATSKKIDEAVETIKYLLEEYEKTEEGSPERSKAKQQVMKEFQKDVKNYNNPITLIPWYQNLMEEELSSRKQTKSLSFSSEVSNAIEQKTENLIIMSDKGIPDLSDVPEEEATQANVTVVVDENGEEVNSDSDCAYREMLSVVYEKGVEKNLIVKDDTGKQMLTMVFGNKDSVKKIKYELSRISSEELSDRYNKFAKQMDTQYKNFANTAKQLIEEVVGVRMFFEQSRIKKNRMQPKLLVTNCSLDAFIGKEGRLRQYLEKTNRTASDYGHAIWYAIIPNMKLEDEEAEDDWFDSVSSDAGSRGTNSASSVSKMVKLLGEYNIQSFVGFENNAGNTFADIQQKGIQKYKDATSKFTADEELNKYMIPCIPNFTVVPESKSRIKSQGEYRYDADEAVNDVESLSYVDKGYIELGGFYINASYIAAGIVCACQSPDYLRDKKIKVVDNDADIPGVRFDLEGHFDKIDVKMGVEVGGYSEKVKSEINDEQFGFIFASEGGAKTHIMTARCLKKTEDGEFEPIFVTSTYTYIERLYRTNVSQITKGTMEEFFGDSKMSTFWKKYLEYDNALLQKDDSLHYEISGKNANLDLKLKGVERQLSLSINH